MIVLVFTVVFLIDCFCKFENRIICPNGSLRQGADKVRLLFETC